MTDLKNFLDADGRLTSFPAKRKMKFPAMRYLASKLEQGRTYSEKDLNEALERWHTFHDPATLRREMYDAHFLDREKNGRTYWLEEPQPELQEGEGDACQSSN